MVSKKRMRLAKYKKTADLDIIAKIQDSYIMNLIAYKDSLTHNHKKAVIKRCYQIVDLFKKIEEAEDDFVSDWVKKETVDLESSFEKSNYSFGTLYEQVQVAIHSSLRDIGFGYCLEHKINIHHCRECQLRLGIDEDNLYD